MQFEWNKKKAEANLKKHGTTFDEASTVFSDPLARIFDDEDHSAEEARDKRPEMSGRIMKKTRTAKNQSAPDEMRPEYRLDYDRSKPNRFAAGEGRAVVVLDPDIAEVFTTTESVNAVLRALITTMPRTQRRKTSNK